METQGRKAGSLRNKMGEFYYIDSSVAMNGFVATFFYAKKQMKGLGR